MKDLLAGPNPPRLVDIRTREEYDAVHLENAHIFSQDLLNQIFAEWPKESPIVIYDHSGSRTLDAATYLIGHGFSNVKCLEGGIDQYAAKIDPSLTRYKIEFED
ncbi:MAG: rhodanese-like domain-containing protein [Verrucomicrobiota bacterium]